MGFVIKPSSRKEITMSSSSTQPTTSEDRRSRSDRPRRDTPKALVWLMIAVIAAFPFPWWW